MIPINGRKYNPQTYNKSVKKGRITMSKGGYTRPDIRGQDIKRVQTHSDGILIIDLINGESITVESELFVIGGGVHVRLKYNGIDKYILSRK